MPLRDMKCVTEACGHEFEILISNAELESTVIRCPACGSRCEVLPPKVANAVWNCECPTASGGKQHGG